MTPQLIVTGVSGLLGATLATVAVERGLRVVGVARQHRFCPAGAELVHADLTAPESVKMISAMRPQFVVHCAAATAVDWCEDHPEEVRRINVDTPRRLAQACSECGALFVYISTDAVFDGERGNYSESDPPAPVNIYGRSKLAGERAVQEAGGRSLILRTSIYGWNSQSKLSLAEWFLDRLQTGAPTSGFTDVIFSPLLVNDLSEIILDLLACGATGLHHAASRDSCSKYEFGIKVAQAFGLPGTNLNPTRLGNASLKARRPLNTSLCAAKLSETLSRPMQDLNSALEWFRRLRETGFADRLKACGGEPVHA